VDENYSSIDRHLVRRRNSQNPFGILTPPPARQPTLFTSPDHRICHI